MCEIDTRGNAAAYAAAAHNEAPTLQRIRKMEASLFLASGDKVISSLGAMMNTHTHTHTHTH